MPDRKTSLRRATAKEIESMRTRLLTLREVADYLHVHPGTVYRLVKKGELQGLRVGRDFRFDLRVVEDWIGRGGTSSSEPEKAPSRRPRQSIYTDQGARLSPAREMDMDKPKR
jgi:excisionase family DNA binding protein